MLLDHHNCSIGHDFWKRFTKVLISLIVLSLVLDIETGTESHSSTRWLGSWNHRCVCKSRQPPRRVRELQRSSAEDVPLYLVLCEEWIREDTLPEDLTFRAFKVVKEDHDVCIRTA
jgi:hypothetical protein